MRKLRWFSLLSASLVILACGGGGGTTSGGGGGGGGSIDEGTKLTFLNSAAAQMNGWRALPRATRHANLVAWAKSQPGVADAGIAAQTDTVWIRYTDGDGTAYFDNKGSSVPPPRRIAPKDSGDMPGDLAAYTIYSLEHDKFPDVTDSIRLDLSNQGYNATRLENPTLEQIIAMRGAGVIFWQCHGGMVTDKRNNVVTTRYGFETGQQATQALGNGAYKGYRDAGEVLVCAREVVAADGTITQLPMYTITDRFVSKYMLLADHAFVAIDGCTSADPGMSAAFLGINAGTYVGWNNLSGPQSGDRFALMFDRLLGANIEPPLSNPVERAFNIDMVESWMQQKGYDIDPSAGGIAQLKFFFKAGGKSLMLRPTISRILSEANNQQWNFTKYLIEGSFGPDPGAANRKVFWGNKQLNVLSWDEIEGIKVQPPAAPYPQGMIQVVRGARVSNSVPMTEWTWPVTYTMTGKGSLQYKVTLNLKFRCDIKGARFLPEQAVQAYPMVFVNLDDCTGQVTASGTYKPSQNTTITWSGGTALQSKDSAFPANGILLSGIFNRTTSTIDQVLIQTSGTFKRTVKSGSTTTTNDQAATMDGYFTFSTPYVKSSSVIPAGSTPPTMPYGTPDAVSATMTWPSTTPVFPPSDQTPRRGGR